MNSAFQNLDPLVLGQKLRQARSGTTLTQAAAAKALGMARTTLVAIEKGERKVAAAELPGFADLYGTQVSDLVRDEITSEPLLPQFRALHNEEEISQDLKESVRSLEGLARDYLNLEHAAGANVLTNYPPTYQYRISNVNADHMGAEVAAEERKRLSLGETPIRDLRALLEEEVGLRIFYLKLPAQVSGIYAFTEELGGCVAINRAHPASRSSWSLAHEYGHFLSTRTAADVSFSQQTGWGKAYDERFADSFAKNFLMPRNGVHQSLTRILAAEGGGITVAHVLSLSHKFNVSAQAMFRRLEELKRLPHGTWEKLVEQNFKPETAKETLGLSNTRREPMLPFRYRLLAQRAFDKPESEMTEAEFSQLLRTDLVSARGELDELRCLVDQGDDSGFTVLSVNVTDEILSA